MTCIGIDPSYRKKVAFAYRHGSQWRVGLADLAAMEAPIREAAAAGVTRAVVEGGYVGVNARVSLKLEAARERLAIYCERAGMTVDKPQPATWVASVEINGVRPKRHKEIVDAAKFKARLLTGLHWGEDESVAVCLADYGDMLRKRKELTE